MEAPRLLLVDADAVLCQTLADYLRAHSFRVTVKHDGETGLQHASADAHDLVLLGDMPPGLNGGEVLRQIRRRGELPTVMLCATHDAVEYIVYFELGADDCLAKSCNLRELVARLRSILRRSRQAGARYELPNMDAAALSLSPAERTVTWRGMPLHLTGTEFELLEVLFSHAGAVSKADLAASVLGRAMGKYDRSLEMHISNLRKKLGRLADGRSPIQTIRGAGYQLIGK
ncbi:MAG: response regulator transcription factor [Sulfuritalea sp.]|nr:response regulator transcription factor [Sulfuritalea sp.]